MSFPVTRRLKLALKTLCGLAFVLCPKIFAEPVVTVRDNGDPANRVDLVILGDGYTASEMSKYAYDVERLLTGFFAEEPLQEYRRYFNVHRIDAISNESGADHSERTPPVEKDTAFDSRYNCNNVVHAICAELSKILTVIDNSGLTAARRDVILMLVNDPQRGGLGGSVAISSTGEDLVDTMLHEFGHSLADLADEYTYGAWPSHCSNTREPHQPNVTRETDRASIKWNHWIDPETAIPTTTTLNAIPGLYKGGYYCGEGYFRPTYDSKMHTSNRPFEQVNSEAIVKSIYNLVSPLDHSFPEDGHLTLEAGRTQTFYVSTPVPATHELTVRWLVDGELQGRGLQYTLDSGGLGGKTHTVEAVVEDRTPLVRNDPDEVLTDRRSWNVTIGSATGKPDLVIASLTASSTATVGRQASIAAYIDNEGSADAGPFRFQAYLTRDFSEFFTLAECDFDSGLPGGGSQECTGPVTLPSSILPGVYYVGAFVDSHQQVAESNELNNKRLSDSGLFTVLKRPGLFVPVILEAFGLNDSFFTSELTLTNRGPRAARLDYTYTAHVGSRSGAAFDVLLPGRQKIVPDAYEYLRTLGIPIPRDGEGLIGTVAVEFPLASSDVGVSVRTTTGVEGGRAGLAYPGVPKDEGFQRAVYLCGLRQNDQDRSNAAFQNMGTQEEGPITLRTTVFSGDPTDSSPRVLEDVTLEPGGFHQYSRVLGSVANGYVKVERVEGTAPFYAYGVINDQVNSDGSFIFPVTAGSLEGAVGQTLPVIVQTGGFTSELTVTNFSETARTVHFDFLAEGVGTDEETARFSLTLEAGEQRIIADVVDYLRRQRVAGIGPARRSYAGAVFAMAEGGDMSGIVIGARTGSPDGRGGQYGVFYTAVPDGAAFTESAWMHGLQQNEENRSNLALVNTGEADGSESVFRIEIYDGDTGGLAGTVTTRPLPARRWRQIGSILRNHTRGTTQGYVRIRKISGNNPFLAYGVVNDGASPGEPSGDGAYLTARE